VAIGTGAVALIAAAARVASARMVQLRCAVAVLVVGCSLGLGARAQDGARLDAERITSGEFAAATFGPVRWVDATHFTSLEVGAAGVPEIVRHDAKSGGREVVVTAAMLWRESAGAAITIEDYAFAPAGDAVLVFTQSERVWRQRTRGEYFVIALDGKTAPRRLGQRLPTSSLMFAKWSPDGSAVAYVAERDLYVEPLATGTQVRLTADGSATVINGTFDWVYEEEFDCRDGFRWSPDGASIAFWQLDCRGVGEFLMIDNLADRYAKVVPVQYPKAGTTNSACRIGVVPARGGAITWMQTPGEPRETYLPRMEWHPAGRELMVQWLPRSQQELRVLGCDVETGAVREVHAEQDPAYIDVRDDFRWLEAGERFLWTSDTAFTAPGAKAVRQVGAIVWDTRGKHLLVSSVPLTRGFDVIDVVHCDLPANVLLVSCGEPATQKTLRQALATGQPWSTPATGWHEYLVAPDGALAIHTQSSFDVPPRVELVALPSHEVVRTLVDNEPLRERYGQVSRGRNEFFTVAIEAGVTLDGWAMYPADFDPTQSWPVLFHVYGEPWSQTVKDTWSLGHHLFHRWLTQLGYVVMSLDARGTPAPKGRDWRKALYQRLGVTSSADWHAAVLALRRQHAWMDPARQAVWGWSGGGAMTLNLLFRHPDLFAAGMSVAPVTDIALYDTIYQERYCGDPRQVPEVYRQCSPITFAGQLRAKLLLVHGTGDDNVHYQHSERLFDALVQHGKLFEFLGYPNRTHAIAEGRGTRAHLYGSLADFLQRRVPAGPRPAVGGPGGK
jgi:dipeptidyl-peptidase-4